MAGSVPPRRVQVPITEDVDVYLSRSKVRVLALSLGFSPKATGELVIVASELAWNILKYADHGVLEIMPAEDEQLGIGLCLMARDNGPAFHDFATALIDGHDDRGPIDPMELLNRGGIGGGLGAVKRFTDRLTYTHDENGKCISAFRSRSRR